MWYFCMETFWETNIWNKWKSESVNRLLNLMNHNRERRKDEDHTAGELR